MAQLAEYERMLSPAQAVAQGGIANPESLDYLIEPPQKIDHSRSAWAIPRMLFIENYGWSVPNLKLLHGICEFAGDATIVVPASGKGFLPALINAKRGTDNCECFDVEVSEKAFVKTTELDAANYNFSDSEDKVLLLSWIHPDQSWLLDKCLAEFKGTKYVFIGEIEGCTAFDSEMVGWTEVETIEIPRFIGLHDCAILYRRGV